MDNIGNYQHQRAIFANEAEVTPSITHGTFLWQQVRYAPQGEQLDSARYYRGYGMVTPNDLIAALAVVRTVALERAANGEETLFKWLMAKVPFEELQTPGADTLGQYRGLDSKDPLITFYMKEKADIQSVLGRCALNPQWAALEQHRVGQSGTVTRNDTIPFKTRLFGKPYYSLTYVPHSGHSEPRQRHRFWIFG